MCLWKGIGTAEYRTRNVEYRSVESLRSAILIFKWQNTLPSTFCGSLFDIRYSIVAHWLKGITNTQHLALKAGFHLYMDGHR